MNILKDRYIIKTLYKLKIINTISGKISNKDENLLKDLLYRTLNVIKLDHSIEFIQNKITLISYNLGELISYNLVNILNTI